MSNNEEISLLIVDDSRVFRSILESVYAKIPGVRIAASLWSGEKALEWLKSNSVDLISLDVEMPILDGLECLRRIQELDLPHKPGVLMVSSLTRSGADTTVRALELGAFDFVAKPGPEMLGAKESLERMLALKVNGWRNRRVRVAPFATPVSRPPVFIPKSVSAVLIGVSTGGPRALAELLPRLGNHIHCPICIVQHMPPTFTRSLASSLDKRCRQTVVEAEAGMVLESDHIYIAPGGYHMVFEKRLGKVQIALNSQEPENGCRPSVDVMFRSAADTFPPAGTIAVVLTGMGCDGAAGLRPLKANGSYIIVQDEESSVVWGMPGSAVAAGLVDEVQSLQTLADAIGRRIEGNP